MKRILLNLMGAVAFALLLMSHVAAETPNDDPPVHEPTNSAVITNGTIKLGVRDQGHLNIAGAGILSRPSSPTTSVGLRLIFPDGSESEATAPGCLCEGWGASAGGVSGYATTDNAFPAIAPSLSFVSFVDNGVEATSIVEIGGVLRVTHAFRPAPPTPFLYESAVTLENISGAPVTDIRYRRVMDWDISPTTFSECVTINSGTAVDLAYVTNNGFDHPDPLFAPVVGGSFSSGDRVDDGPRDHGALFQFEFKENDGVTPLTLDPGETKTFKIYYGGAFSQPQAEGALAAVSAEAFSFGKPHAGGVCTDDPNVFIFAFGGIGGDPIFPGCTLDPVIDVNPLGSDHSVMATVSESGVAQAGVDVQIDVIAGPNTGAGSSGSTDAAGQFGLTYTSNGTPGVDTIEASGALDDGSGNLTPFSCSAVKFWDDDCQGNGIPDTCDLDCGGFGGDCAVFAGCGGSVDANQDGRPDECASCGDGVVNQPSETCDDGNNVSGDGCSASCNAEQHDLCYGLRHSDSPPFGGANVILADPLYPAGRSFVVKRPKRFCTPAEKTHDGNTFPIVRPEARAVTYPIRAASGESPFVQRPVQIDNQFGAQTLLLTREDLLWVPTEVVGDPWDTGTENHYKCYRVKSPFARRSVTVSEPFFGILNQLTNVRRPSELCLAATKTHGAVVTPPADDSRHLTCYDIRQPGVAVNQTVAYLNQFEGTTVSPQRSSCSVPGRLCVPTRLVTVP